MPQDDELRPEYDFGQLRVRRMGPGRKLSAEGVESAPDVAYDTFTQSVAPEFVPIVAALDRAIAAAGLDTRISYKMLTYASAGDFRHWVCAIGASSKVVSLRFLFGALLDDPRGLFRAGTSPILRTLDFASVDDVDEQVVAGFVRQAVSRLDTFRAHARELQEK